MSTTCIAFFRLRDNKLVMNLSLKERSDLFQRLDLSIIIQAERERQSLN